MIAASKDFAAQVVAKINPQEIVENGVFDTLLFSDRYRRGVVFFGGQHHGLVSELAEMIRRSGTLSTDYYPELPASDATNREVMSRMVRRIRDIDWRVAELGAEKIILPFGGRGNIFAASLKKALKDHEFQTAIELRGREYNLDLSSLGAVRKDKPTILDEDIRGVCNYKSDLRYKWDREVA